jgi:hypothetical protein
MMTLFNNVDYKILPIPGISSNFPLPKVDFHILRRETLCFEYTLKIIGEFLKLSETICHCVFKDKLFKSNIFVIIIFF